MNIPKGAHVHFIGICGTAMASLAGLMKSMGYRISGSDQNVYPPMSTQLQSLGIQIQQGYKAENLIPRPDFVVVGNVIPKVNPEAQALLATDIPYTSLPKILGDLVIAQKNSVVIAGTHGKTTTTAMMSVVAENSGLEPGFLIGGIPSNFSNSFQAPKGNWFVIEGDEYDTAFFDKVPKFIHYKPKYVILTSVEFDHADIYRDLEHVKSAFRSLVDLIPKDGILVAHAEEKNVADVITQAKCKVVTYGEEKGDYTFADRQWLMNRNQFSVKKQGKKIADIAIKAIGPHNALNALAVFALAKEAGWPESKILQGLADFKGVRRRQEIIGTPNDIVVIEDFAHHPTAVRVTLRGVRESFADKKIFAVFEPRSATSRRKIFQEEYGKAFDDADEVLIPPAFDQSKINEGERFSSEDLVDDLKKRGRDAFLVKDNAEIIRRLKSQARPGDVIIIMSNGGFGGIFKPLLEELAR